MTTRRPRNIRSRRRRSALYVYREKGAVRRTLLEEVELQVCWGWPPLGLHSLSSKKCDALVYSIFLPLSSFPRGIHAWHPRCLALPAVPRRALHAVAWRCGCVHERVRRGQGWQVAHSCYQSQRPGFAAAGWLPTAEAESTRPIADADAHAARV